jgi:uncharacterized membrane protein
MPQAHQVRSVTQRVFQSFITGIFAILPLALTLAILAWVAVYLHDRVGPNSAIGKVLLSLGLTVTGCEVTAYFLGVTGAVLVVYCLGVLVENSAGRRWRVAMDGALQRIPVVGTVYDASRSLTGVFDQKSETLQGMTPVMCSFGDNGVATIPALMPTKDVIRLGDNDYHVVVIPSAPVPFSFALLCVKAEWVKPAECGFDELMGIYMSMGLSAPKCLGRSTPGDAQRDPAKVGIA